MTFIINLEIYPFDVLFHFGTKKGLIKELSKYLSKKSVNDIVDYDEMEINEGKFLCLPNNAIAVHLPTIPNTPDTYGTLSHEISHVVFEILDRKVGIPYIEESEEAYTYLIGFITSKVFKKIMK